MKVALQQFLSSFDRALVFFFMLLKSWITE